MLVVPERRAALDQLVVHATTLRIPVVELEGGSLTSLAGFDGHQGIALIAKPRPTADLDDIVAHARQRGAQPFVLVLDSLEDPQNFGTLLRSAEATGVDGVVYPTRRAAPLSPSAIKASAGATEHMLLAPVDDLAGALVDLRGHGLRIVGADENAPLEYSEADLRGPLAIVVGSEGRGISGPVRKRLDMAVRIPMRGKIASLNASVAGSLLLFAAASQRPDPITAPAAAPEGTSTPETAAPQDPVTEPATADEPPAKPKRTSSKTAKPKAAAAPATPDEPPAKPKRTSSKTAKPKAAAAPATPDEPPAKPKRTRAKTAKPKAAAAPSETGSDVEELLPSDG